MFTRSRLRVRILFLCSLVYGFLLAIQGSFCFSLNREIRNVQSDNSIIDEHRNCDLVIPKFIEQVMSHEASFCQKEGNFPKPGNCTVFFKCIQSNQTIQPFVEYCAIGYNFVGGVCLPNTNSKDCPQYTCRIPDGTHDSGNDIEATNSEGQSTGNEPSPLPSASSLMESTSDTNIGDDDIPTTTVSTVPDDVEQSTLFTNEPGLEHSEQLMQTQTTQFENSKGSSSSTVISHFWFLFLFVSFIL